MARKTLLSESEIRRFMKLADMQPIGNKRLTEWNGISEEEEEEFSFGEPEGEAEAPMGEEPDFGTEVEEEPMDDMEMGQDVEDVAMDDEEKAAELAQRVASAVEEIYGVEMNVEGDAVTDEDPVAELPVEEPVEEPADFEVEEPVVDDAPLEGGEDEVALAETEAPATHAAHGHLIDHIDQLTERIFKRIAGK